MNSLVKNEELVAQQTIAKLRLGNDLKQRKKRKNKKKIWFAIALFVVLLALLHIPRTPKMEFAQVTAERTGVAANAFFRISGYVAYERSVDIGTTERGPVLDLYFEESSRVQKGQLLAVLENRELRAQKELQSSVLATAERAFGRAEKLYERRAISTAEFELSQVRYDSARFNLDIIAARLAKTKIRAPFSGKITNKIVEVGGLVDGRVATLVDDAITLVEVDVSQDDISRIDPKQPAVVMLDSYPRTEYAAQVYKIDPEGDKSQNTVTVKVRIQQPDFRFKPELSARVFFVNEAQKANRLLQTRLVVDSRAVQSSDGHSYVWVVDDAGLVSRVEVELGQNLSGNSEVLTGLTEGVRVILAPQSHNLQEGMNLENTGLMGVLQALHQ